jgi:hypothetical protein
MGAVTAVTKDGLLEILWNSSPTDEPHVPASHARLVRGERGERQDDLCRIAVFRTAKDLGALFAELFPRDSPATGEILTPSGNASADEALEMYQHE